MSKAIDNIKQETLTLYKKILCREWNECSKHAIKYNLKGTEYNERYDAIGLTYYKILEQYPYNKELVEYAHKKFME